MHGDVLCPLLIEFSLFLTRSDTLNPGPVQSQKKASSFIFQVKEEEGLYYLCSKNNGATDLRLCFRIMQNVCFPILGGKEVGSGRKVNREISQPTQMKFWPRKNQKVYVYLAILFYMTIKAKDLSSFGPFLQIGQIANDI